MSKRSTPALLLGTATFLLIACSGSANNVQTIKVVAQTMQFQPDTIEVVAGQPVNLTFQNNDTVEHDFSILEIPVTSVGATSDPMAEHVMTTDPQLHTAASMSQTSSIDFTPTKAGSYEYFCTVPGHKEAGMKGTLIVKAP